MYAVGIVDDFHRVDHYGREEEGEEKVYYLVRGEESRLMGPYMVIRQKKAVGREGPYMVIRQKKAVGIASRVGPTHHDVKHVEVGHTLPRVQIATRIPLIESRFSIEKLKRRNQQKEGEVTGAVVARGDSAVEGPQL